MLKCSIILRPRRIPCVCVCERERRGGGGKKQPCPHLPEQSGAARSGAGTAEPAALPVQRPSLAGERGAPGGRETGREGGREGKREGKGGGDAAWLGGREESGGEKKKKGEKEGKKGKDPPPLPSLPCPVLSISGTHTHTPH